MERTKLELVIPIFVVYCFCFVSLSVAKNSLQMAELEKVFIAKQAITPEECKALEVREADSSTELFRVIAGDETETATRIGMFIPNRIMDILDIVSFQIYVPLVLKTPGFHITRFCNILELSVGGEEGIGWEYRRNLCLYASLGYETNLLGLTGYHFNSAGIGTNWGGDGRSGSGEREYAKELSYNKLNEAIYGDEVRDPWGIGFYDDLEIHPVEIFDAIVGWITFGFVDISGDDYAP